jgi:hypothetical protein
MNPHRHPVQARRTPLLSRHARPSLSGGIGRGTYLQRLPLAGFEHHEAARLWPYLRTGQALLLSRERTNPVDSRAVRISWLGEHLGYLPRVSNSLASDLLDDGVELIARIHTLRETDDPWARIDLDLYLTRNR